MHKQNPMIQVMLPSTISGLASLAVAILTLAVTTFYYYVGSGMIYNLIFGKNSSVELVAQSRGSVDTLTNTVFGNLVLNKILYFGFWMMVGLLVYLLLYILIKGLSSAAADIEQAGYKNSRIVEMKQAIAGRLAIRAILIVAWVIYWVAFIRTVLPFSILAARDGATLFPNLSGWFYLLVGALALTAALHVHLIFVRLIALKTRLLA